MTSSGLPKTHRMYLPVALITLKKPTFQYGYQSPFGFRQDIQKGITRDWGSFVGEIKGYAVNEGTEIEVMKALQQYVPFCIFKVHPISTESQVNEMKKGLTG
jgi:hypothetical protein